MLQEQHQEQLTQVVEVVDLILLQEQVGASGGSGIVILRARSSSIGLTASPGTNTVTTQPCGQDVASFTVSGSLGFTPAVSVDYLVVAGGGGGASDLVVVVELEV
jgi:hypothetical protein